jgi:hypothetical protein
MNIVFDCACGVKASLDGKHVTGVGVGYDANFCEYCDDSEPNFSDDESDDVEQPESESE